MISLKLNSSRSSTDLLMYTTRRRGGNVFLATEHIRDMFEDGTWYADSTRTATATTIGCGIIVYSRAKYRDLIYLDLGDVAVMCIYIFLNISMEEFKEGLDRVTSWLRDGEKELLLPATSILSRLSQAEMYGTRVAANVRGLDLSSNIWRKRSRAPQWRLRRSDSGVHYS